MTDQNMVLPTVFHPLEDRVIVLPIEEVEQKSGSLYVPSVSTDTRPLTGRVHAVGDGPISNGVRVAIPLKLGQIVLFARNRGIELNVQGKKHLLLNTSDILVRLS